MTIIQLHTHGQTLFQQTDAVIAAGDRETVRLVIETDAEWLGYTPYAILWRDGRRDLAVSLPLCEAGCCLIPALLLAESGTLHVALAGRDSLGRVKTSTAIRYRILPGAPDGEGVILADVARASATPDQVLGGATFYAGTDQMLTGAIPTYEEGEILSDEIVDSLTVTADFSEGDQSISAEGMAPMRTVTVQKPDTLDAAYIARGIRIAGIEGTLPTLPEVDEEDNGKTLSVVDGAWCAAAPIPTSSLPTVTEDDNGKTLAVVNGAWAITAPAADVQTPVYDLTELGIPSLVVGASISFAQIDTTDFLADLANGAVIIKSAIDLGDGTPMSTSKVCYATVSDGIALITNVDYMPDDVLITMVMVRPDGIAAKVSALSQTIGNQIDAYIEEALGGDY